MYLGRVKVGERKKRCRRPAQSISFKRKESEGAKEGEGGKRERERDERRGKGFCNVAFEKQTVKKVESLTAKEEKSAGNEDRGERE